MYKNILVWLGLFITSTIPLFTVHSYVLHSHLRHGMVSDGSVSQYAGNLLDERDVFEKYKEVMASDGKIAGRYRPGYFVYHTIPFFLTMVRNGDFSANRKPLPLG